MSNKTLSKISKRCDYQNKEEHIHLFFRMCGHFVHSGYVLPMDRNIVACPLRYRNRFLEPALAFCPPPSPYEFSISHASVCPFTNDGITHLSPRQTPPDASQKTQKNTEHSEAPSTSPHPTPWSPNHKSSPAASPA